MKVPVSKLSVIFLVSILIMLSASSIGQICNNKYLSLVYKGTTYDTFTCAVNENNETISAGRLYDYNEAGHITKFSANGSPIWSYQYMIDFYDFYKAIFFKAVNFRDILGIRNGGYLLSGNVEQVLSPYGTPPPVKKYALLAKVDKFGKVLWNKTLSNMGDLSISNIYETADGSYIAYLATDNGGKRTTGDHSYGKILKIGVDGSIIWSSQLFTFLFDAGGLGVDYKRAITQTRKKNIIIGQVVHQTEFVQAGFRIYQGNLHFLELDYTTGKINWETSYEYPVPAFDPLYTPDLVRVDELPDGRLSFITTMYLSTPNNPALTTKGVNILTSEKGKIESITAYYPANKTSCSIKQASLDKKTGNKMLWIKNNGEDVLTNISATGNIKSSIGFSSGGGQFPVNCFAPGAKGYYIFGSNNASLETRLLISDTAGAVDCVNIPEDMVAEQAGFDFPHDSVMTSTSMNFDDYQDFAYPLKRSDVYPLIKKVVCQQTISCCTDFIDSLNYNKVTICEGQSFTLPDSTVVKDSGTYYVTFKTLPGCDSIRFYKVNLDKDVALLSVGKDTCLTQSNSIKLMATPGYDKYYWLNSTIATDQFFDINRPGIYSVSVANKCGTKTDSLTVFDQCDYPLYMPKAFTPNGDNLNDYYRVPPSNKNHLLSFKIFNRWGKLVFSSTNPLQGWDGRFHNEPLPSDTFIYMIEMEGLSGKRLSEKGSFILLR